MTGGVIRAPSRRPLIPTTRGTHRLAPGHRRTRPRAVPMAIVALGAQEEDLAAANAGHEAEGLDVRVGPIL